MDDPIRDPIHQDPVPVRPVANAAVVERVARAMYASDNPAYSWEGSPEHEIYLFNARRFLAAYEVLRAHERGV